MTKNRWVSAHPRKKVTIDSLKTRTQKALLSCRERSSTSVYASYICVRARRYHDAATTANTTTAAGGQLQESRITITVGCARGCIMLDHGPTSGRHQLPTTGRPILGGPRM